MTQKKTQSVSGLWEQFKSPQTTEYNTISILFWLFFIFFISSIFYLYHNIHYFSSLFFQIFLAVQVLSPSYEKMTSILKWWNFYKIE